MGEMKRYELLLPIAFWEKLKKRAKANERHVAAEIRHILKEVLEKKDK